MKLLRFCLSLILICLLTGCDDLYTSGRNVTGKVGEVLVVCDDAIWNSSIKNDLDSGLTQFIMPYFPDVATFELIHRNNRKFEGAIKRHRNVLFLKIDNSYKPQKGKLQYKEGVWSHRQLVVEVIANNYKELAKTCKANLKQIHNRFEVAEWNRLRKYFSEKQDIQINTKIGSNFGLHVDLPDASKIVTVRKNFYRIELPVASRPIEFVGSGQQDIGAILSGILIYQYPFVDSSQLEFGSLMKARDTMLKYNVPHESSGMYMGSQYNEFVYPEYSRSSNYNGTLNGIEIRGMFVFKGRYRHSTGGAFWSFHFLHPKTKKVVCVSGYVDAPSTTSWTHAIRELQAIWKSVTIL